MKIQRRAFEMEEKTIGLGILIVCVIVAGILIGMAIGGFDAFDGQRRGGMMMDSDRVFIGQMIPHHQDAIDMGNLALVRAEHTEIRQLAENVIRDQSREIAWMRTWYKAWYGTDVPVYEDLMRGGGMMSGGVDGRMTDLEQLGNATPFDKEFIEQMVPHHQMAIMMAQMILNSDRKEMRDLGRSIIMSQSSEVDQMREWYYTWYGTPVRGFSMRGMNRRF